MRSGMRVRAIDSSSEMVRIARGRGVDATWLAIEELRRLKGVFDGAISNFGPLNCIRSLDRIPRSLARLVRPRRLSGALPHGALLFMGDSLVSIANETREGLPALASSGRCVLV